MSRSRPGSRPVSRQNSFSEHGVHIPVDSRIAGHHDPHHERADGRPVQMFGPGFSSAPVNSAEERYKYILVTAEMLKSIESGHAPQTHLVHPAGTQLAPAPTRNHLSTQEISQVPALEKGHTGGVSDISDKHSTGELVETSLEPEDAPLVLANPIARLRYRYKEYFGEFLGTMVLIIFGNGVNCQVVLSNLTQGSYLSISHGWGAGVMFGVYIAGGVSGAHLSPAVTTALAVFRGFPWRKVPGYFLAQLLGAMVGSIFIQANYKNLIDQFEGGAGVRTFGEATSTATLFFTAAQPYMTNVSAFFSEFGATAVLLAVILCLGDANNNPCPPGMNGLILFFLILAIGAALGTQTAYCLNPARDLGPRIAASMFGYPGEIWTYRNGYWFWCVCVATISGACAGCFIYDLLIYQGADSPLNKPFELPWSKKAKQAKAIKEGGQA